MKYVAIDDVTSKKGVAYAKEFTDKAEAVTYADHDFGLLTDYDKSMRDGYYILESADPDENSERHLDGDIVKRYL